MNARAHVLVIDDDEDIRNLVAELLQRAGLEVDQAADGRSGLRAFHQSPPDLVVLDVSLPDLDGWQTLERIRDLSDVPVMMVTARGAELERVRGLQAGADDYLVKPFGRQELVARVQALLRRARPSGGDRQATYADDRITIDFAQRSVSYDGRDVTLTPLEFKLLAAFVRHPRQVLSREQLLQLVWGDTYGVSGDQVKLYVGYLRRKLDPEQPDRVPIETVRGFGYRYQAAR
jgi:DNA-binding response OmpR family regulator